MYIYLGENYRPYLSRHESDLYIRAQTSSLEGLSGCNRRVRFIHGALVQVQRVSASRLTDERLMPRRQSAWDTHLSIHISMLHLFRVRHACPLGNWNPPGAVRDCTRCAIHVTAGPGPTTTGGAVDLVVGVQRMQLTSWAACTGLHSTRMEEKA